MDRICGNCAVFEGCCSGWAAATETPENMKCKNFEFKNGGAIQASPHDAAATPAKPAEQPATQAAITPPPDQPEDVTIDLGGDASVTEYEAPDLDTADQPEAGDEVYMPPTMELVPPQGAQPPTEPTPPPAPAQTAATPPPAQQPKRTRGKPAPAQTPTPAADVQTPPVQAASAPQTVQQELATVEAYAKLQQAARVSQAGPINDQLLRFALQGMRHEVDRSLTDLNRLKAGIEAILASIG